MEAGRRTVPPLKLAILQNVVAPTRHALFAALGSRPGVDLTVFFMSQHERGRGWRFEGRPEYRHEILRGLHMPWPGPDETDTLHLNPGVVPAVRRGRFDALLCSGYLSPTAWLAFAAARASGARFLLWYGSSWPANTLRGRIARPLKRAFVRSADGHLVYGDAARAQLLELGAAPQAIWTGTNTTDLAPFAEAAAARPAGPPTAIWVGRFIERKHPEAAVRLLAGVRQRVPELRALFVGDGPLRRATEQAARDAGLPAEFFGERPYAELPALYARAHVLVTLAEREPWGLVVNEALAAGLPVLATPGVTAARELLPAGAGLVSADEVALAEEAVRLLESAAAREEARFAASAVLPRLTPEAWADAVLAAAAGRPAE